MENTVTVSAHERNRLNISLDKFARERRNKKRRDARERMADRKEAGRLGLSAASEAMFCFDSGCDLPGIMATMAAHAAFRSDPRLRG